MKGRAESQQSNCTAGHTVDRQGDGLGERRKMSAADILLGIYCSLGDVKLGRNETSFAQRLHLDASQKESGSNLLCKPQGK